MRDPPIGQFDVTCHLTQISDNSTVDTLNTTSGRGLTILNSQLIKPIAIDASSSDSKNYQVSFFYTFESMLWLRLEIKLGSVPNVNFSGGFSI